MKDPNSVCGRPFHDGSLCSRPSGLSHAHQDPPGAPLPWRMLTMLEEATHALANNYGLTRGHRARLDSIMEEARRDLSVPGDLDRRLLATALESPSLAGSTMLHNLLTVCQMRPFDWREGALLLAEMANRMHAVANEATALQCPNITVHLDALPSTPAPLVAELAEALRGALFLAGERSDLTHDDVGRLHTWRALLRGYDALPSTPGTPGTPPGEPHDFDVCSLPPDLCDLCRAEYPRRTALRELERAKAGVVDLGKLLRLVERALQPHPPTRGTVRGEREEP